MVVPRAPWWLAICGFAGCVACGGDARAPRRAVAPVAAATSPVTSSVEPAGIDAPAAPTGPAPASRPDERASVEPAPAESVPEPAPVEPVVASPPCPDDPRRDQHQKPDHVVALAELSAAMTVVDLGSGSGYLLCRLSRAVGAAGRVVATEIGQPLIRRLKQRVAREQLSNVEVIRAPANDVGVAPGTADRILLVNVWHHLPNRARYARRVARALAPGGKIVIVDFEPGTRGSAHGIAPARVLAELAAGGIEGTVVPEDLANQYVIVGAVRAGGS
jgi:predicted methyltransferase